MENLLNKLKNIKPKQLLYPSMVGVIVAVITLVFILSARFLSLNINKAFVVDEKSAESEIVKIDLDDYYAVAKKVGVIANETPPQAVPPPPTITTPAPTPAPSNTTAAAPLTTSEKSAVKIELLNGTGIKGLAAGLALSFTEAGFTVAKTGNTTMREQQTLIKIKQSKQTPELISEITEIVSKKYMLSSSIGIVPETDPSDVIIVIGAK